MAGAEHFSGGPQRSREGHKNMDSTKSRMIGVAVVVCGFAVGMAGLLNYFKYRSTSNRLVTERLVVTGRSVENSIQSSLALGLQFSDIATLPGILDREQATDSLILGIDIFDTEGKLLYSTDRLRASRPVPKAWLEAVRKNGDADWLVVDGDEAAAGISVQNNFDLTIGYLALRFSSDRVREDVRAVGREIALASLAVFLAAAGLSSLALLAVMKRLGSDIGRAEGMLRAGDSVRATAIAARGPFGPALLRFLKTTRLAEAEVARLRSLLQTDPGGAARAVPAAAAAPVAAAPTVAAPRPARARARARASASARAPASPAPALALPAADAWAAAYAAEPSAKESAE
ncbi:MAG: hypothetical protein JNL85_05320 [Rubrivivax sp.]|nr:hypothetical protein [Rubrivivax sp.]